MSDIAPFSAPDETSPSLPSLVASPLADLSVTRQENKAASQTCEPSIPSQAPLETTTTASAIISVTTNTVITEDSFLFAPHSPASVDWGVIPESIEQQTQGRIKTAPIRLKHGRHDGPNRGFGKVHIEAAHGEEFRFCGFDKFVLEAISSFTAIYQQDGKTIVVFRAGKSRLQAALGYQSTGENYYSIITVFRPRPLKKMRGTLVWEKK